MFLSSRNNQFRFEFPRKFIPDEIADKYRAFINRIPGGMIKEPIDIFNYGIQSINLPGPSFDTVTQNDYPGFTRNFRDAKPTQELFDKTLTVTMQSFDGFINYWMAVEMMQYYYSRDGKQPWIPEGVGLQLMDGEGNLFMTAQLKEMIMTGVGALDLNFSSNTVDFQTFDINFVYNILEIKSIATERVRAIPVSTSTAPVCLPAKILLNGSDALDAPSGVRTDIRVLQGGSAVGEWNGRELIIPPCEDAQWELIDTGGGTLSTGSILSGGSAIIVAPDAGYTLEDSLGQILDSGLATSGGSITLAAPNGVWVLEDTFGGVLGTGAILSGGSEIIVAPDATFTLINTAQPPDTLDSGSIPSGGSQTIVAPAVTVIAANSQNTQIGPTVTPPSGGSDVIPLPDVTHTQTYGNPETLPNGVALVCDPALDGAVEINGDAVATVASGGMVNIMVEQDGNPVGAFDPNSNSWVIPSCPVASVSLAVSNTSPGIGETLTLTATPSAGFNPTAYFFYAVQGTNIIYIGQQSGNVLNWASTINGTFKIFVNATDSPTGVFNAGGVDVTSIGIIVNNRTLWLDPHLSGIVGNIYPDLSPTGANGTLVNSPTVDTSVIGGNVNFNGVNQRIINVGTTANFAYIQNTLQFTIMGFIRPSVVNNNTTICGNASGTDGRGHLLRIFPTTMNLDLYRAVGGSLYQIRLNHTHIAGNWMHFAITCNGLGTGQAYLNGVPHSTSITNTSFSLGSGNSIRTMTIGAYQIEQFSLFFNGRIGPLLFYNRELSSAEVLNNFNVDKSRYGL